MEEETCLQFDELCNEIVSVAIAVENDVFGGELEGSIYGCREDCS